ncbi:glycine cleavage system protein GcvH [Fidelibacter multiformis]|jgi:glycine cleavage system H protein|uniref:glycine cleavage system protein GcvH n=1 Tax=Fidelibacter multiformis TaxID=3377529 RepID=UPI0037DD78EF
MNFPKNLKYSDDHEWVRVEGDEAVIGITDFAQSELGDVVYLELPSVGDEVSKGDAFGTIEAVKTVSDMLAPVSGEIIAVNEDLNDSPEDVNKEPYESWLVKIKMSDPSETEDLMDAEAYEEFIG